MILFKNTFRSTMRLLKQISLDGHTLNLSSSLHSFRPNQNEVVNNFGKNLSEILDRNVRLLNSTNNNNSSGVDDHHHHSTSNQESDRKRLLKALEELNSCIVSLIELCKYASQSTEDDKHYEKHKSKLRRHYSALVEGGHLFRSKRLHSLNATSGSGGGGSGGGEKDHSNQLESVIENSIHKLIESNILDLLIKSIGDIGFEEKKIARIIMTNSLTIDFKNNKIIVDYFCASSNQILQCLVESYEFGKSDITLNCGCILRFASQFEPILNKLLRSDYFYKFFTYMQRSSSEYPFDVAMDVFYTFKTIMTKHKRSTAIILRNDYGKFFQLLIDLLEHAENTDDYVTRRQTLELFMEIFSGHERAEFREKFLSDQNDLLCSVIRYIWNRNLQIRLRCLALLSNFFKKTPQSSSKNYDQPPPESLSSRTTRSPSTTSSFVISTSSASKNLMGNLVQKIRNTYIESEYKNNHNDDDHVDEQIAKCLMELKNECLRSNIKQFTTLAVFVEQIIAALFNARTVAKPPP